MSCLEVVDSNKLLFTIALAMILVSVFGIGLFLWSIALMTRPSSAESSDSEPNYKTVNVNHLFSDASAAG